MLVPKATYFVPWHVPSLKVAGDADPLGPGEYPNNETTMFLMDGNGDFQPFFHHKDLVNIIQLGHPSTF